MKVLKFEERNISRLCTENERCCQGVITDGEQKIVVVCNVGYQPTHWLKFRINYARRKSFSEQTK